MMGTLSKDGVAFVVVALLIASAFVFGCAVAVSNSSGGAQTNLSDRNDSGSGGDSAADRLALPAWTAGPLPRVSGDRAFARGSHRFAPGDNPDWYVQAKQSAERDARETIASRMLSTVWTRHYEHAESESASGLAAPVERQRVEHELREHALGTIYDLRVEKEHADQPSGTVWVLVSFPATLLDFSPSGLRARWRETVDRMVRSGRLQAALPLLRSLTIDDAATVDDYVAMREVGFALGLLSEVALTCDRFLARFPNAEDAEEWRRIAAKAREREGITGLDMDDVLGQLEALARRHRDRERLSIALPGEVFPIRDGDGEYSEIALSVRTSFDAFIAVAWEDADGFYWLYEHSAEVGRPTLPKKMWMDTLPIQHTGSSGTCALWVLASAEPIYLPCVEVERAAFGTADAARVATQAACLVRALKEACLGGAVLDRVVFELR